MNDRDLAKARTALNVARRERLAKDGQTAMAEYQEKRSAAYANAERLKELRQARDATAVVCVAKRAVRRKAHIGSTLKPRV
jgi:transcription elongation GreA/GreB family factor